MDQLLYVSVGVVRVNSALQMADILAEARPNNARDGITGVLTAVDGRFIQVIEGAPERLDDLLRRLAEDRRHRDMIVLERRPIDERLFAGWEMVSPRLAPEETARLGDLLDADGAGLDDFVPLLAHAVARQADVLADRDDASARTPDRAASSTASSHASGEA